MNRFLLIIMIFLFSCRSGYNRQKEASEKSLLTDSVSMQTVRRDCARGAAKPIIKKTIYPQTTFVLLPDSITGIETVIFDNGDKTMEINYQLKIGVVNITF